MARQLISGRPVENGDKSSAGVIRAKLNSLVKEIEDAAVREALTYLVEHLALTTDQDDPGN